MKYHVPLFLIIITIFILQCHRTDETKETVTSPSSTGQLLDAYQNMIGLEFGPDSFPAGFVEHTGYVLGYLEGDEYIIDHVSQNEKQLLWLCKLTHRDSVGRPFLKILDMLILPPLEQDETILMGTCNLQDEFDPEIIAIVKFIENDIKSDVHHAWRANRSTGKFETISTRDISCQDESYFL